MFFLHIKQIIFRIFLYFIIKITIYYSLYNSVRINSWNIIIRITDSNLWYFLCWICSSKIIYTIFYTLLWIPYMSINYPAPFILIFNQHFYSSNSSTSSTSTLSNHSFISRPSTSSVSAITLAYSSASSKLSHSTIFSKPIFTYPEILYFPMLFTS